MTECSLFGQRDKRLAITACIYILLYCILLRSIDQDGGGCHILYAALLLIFFKWTFIAINLMAQNPPAGKDQADLAPRGGITDASILHEHFTCKLPKHGNKNTSRSVLQQHWLNFFSNVKIWYSNIASPVPTHVIAIIIIITTWYVRLVKEYRIVSSRDSK